MTLQEFKAWFEGYSEGIDKQPTQKQWARIKERVAEIDGKVVTERVYVDRYNYPPYTYYSGRTISDMTTATVYSNSSGTSSVANGFDSVVAMNALGRAEAAA